MCVRTHGGQRKISDPLQLKIQVVMSHLKWVLGAELLFSTRAVSALNHGALFPTHHTIFTQQFLGIALASCTVAVFEYRCLNCDCIWVQVFALLYKSPQLHRIWNHLKDTHTCKGLSRLGYLNCGQQQSIDWAWAEWKGESEVATSCHLCFLTVEVMWRVVFHSAPFCHGLVPLNCKLKWSLLSFFQVALVRVFPQEK